MATALRASAVLVDGVLAAIGFVIVVAVVRNDPAARPRIHFRGRHRAHHRAHA